MFEFVLSMAMGCGAVYRSGDSYYLSGEYLDQPVDLSDVDADFLGELCAVLESDVVDLGYSFDDLLLELLVAEGEHVDEDEVGYCGDVDGEHYEFFVDFVD